eukprot:5604983-Ditylum_brightwellii.AAC.1
MINQNKEEHKSKSVRNSSKGRARLHRSSISSSSSSSSSSSDNNSSSSISDEENSLQEDKELKQNRNNQKMIRQTDYHQLQLH